MRRLWLLGIILVLTANLAFFRTDSFESYAVSNALPTVIPGAAAVSNTPVNRAGNETTVISATFTDVDQPSIGAFRVTFKIRESGSVTAPQVVPGATNVSVSPVNREGNETTVISAAFTDVDQPPVDAFTVTFKIRDPSMTELVLVNDQPNGSGGLTITDNGGGSYTANYTYDPEDTQALGYYDLQFEVSDGTLSALDAYENNSNELEIIEILQGADLAVSKSVDNYSPFEGEEIVYTVTLSNYGPGDATGITVMDLLPWGLDIQWNSPTQGSYNPSTGEWIVGSVSNGSSAALSLAAMVQFGTSGMTITNVASITSLDQIDPNPGNDTDAVPILVGFQASRAKSQTTEIILVDDQAHGSGGLTIVDNGGGSYTAYYTYDPPTDLTMGYYDLYFCVDDGTGSAVDGYANNIGELEIVETNAGSLIVSDAANYCGATNDTVTVDVTIENNVTPIDAAGIEITYDASILTFVDCIAGDLTESWSTFAASDLGTAVRIGGFDLIPIPQGSTGTFARIRFISSCCDSIGKVAPLCPTNPDDDFSGLTLVCGRFECLEYGPDGDVNDDGSVTPSDALCAFRIWLVPLPDTLGCAGPGYEIRSDVNCDAQTTPADALCIFRYWLDGSCVFCPPSLSTDMTLPSATGNVEVSVEIFPLEDGVLRIPVTVAGLDAFSAFGFDIDFPGDCLEFAGVKRSAASRNFDQLQGVMIERGRLRVGGYAAVPIDVLSGSSILELYFRPLVREPLSGQITLYDFVDDLSPAAVATAPLGRIEPGSFAGACRFIQNHPNPFNPTTQIVYGIPAEDAGKSARLTVYNVDGKRVKVLVDGTATTGIHSLVWDGRDNRGELVSSGVYFCVMRIGAVTLEKKMVLLK